MLKNIVAKAGSGIMPLGGEIEQSGGHKGYGYGMFCKNCIVFFPFYGYNRIKGSGYI